MQEKLYSLNWEVNKEQVLNGKLSNALGKKKRLIIQGSLDIHTSQVTQPEMYPFFPSKNYNTSRKLRAKKVKQKFRK